MLSYCRIFVRRNITQFVAVATGVHLVAVQIGNLMTMPILTLSYDFHLSNSDKARNRHSHSKRSAGNRFDRACLWQTAYDAHESPCKPALSTSSPTLDILRFIKVN